MRTPRSLFTVPLVAALAACAGTDPAPNTAGTSPSSDAAGVITSGQPSDDALRAHIADGRTIIISLRTEGEPGQETEAITIAEAGGRFERLPVAGADGLTRENVEALHALLVSPGETLLHCGSSNRAGAMLALHAFLYEGASREEALAIGEAAGMRSLRAAVEARIDEWCAAGLGSCASAE